MVEWTTQLLIPSNILCLPLCQIYKFGLNTLPSKTVAIPYTCGLSTTQFEHNKYFTEELTEHSIVLDAIIKQLDDITREVCNLQYKYAFAKSLLGKISNAQATLVNQMAAKPISLEDKNDEDLKMIGVSSIDSLFSKN